MKHLTTGWYLLLAFAVAFPLFILPRIVKIARLECFSQYGICEDEILSLTKGSVGKNYKDAKDYVSGKLGNYGPVAEFSFAYRVPATLRIDVVLKKGMFALYGKDSPEIAVLDRDGVVLQKTDKTGLPGVLVSDNLPGIGEKVSGGVIFALRMVYDLNFLYQVTLGEITADGFKVSLPGGPDVIFPLTGEREVLLGALRLVLSQLNQKEVQTKIKTAKLIDLRFKNPIIR